METNDIENHHAFNKGSPSVLWSFNSCAFIRKILQRIKI